MDPWKELAAREECRDAACAWAKMERQSLQAAEGTAHKPHSPSINGPHWKLALGAGVKLAAWAYETWWHMTRR